MRIEQRIWTKEKGWSTEPGDGLAGKADLMLVFGSGEAVRDRDLLDQAAAMYPGAQLFGCSTSGEIAGQRVFDDSLAVTAVRFHKTRIAGAQVDITEAEDSRDVGQRLAQSLDKNGLRHVLVLSDGLYVNGTDLVGGLSGNLPKDVSITGGLAGDKDRFKETLVIFGNEFRSRCVAVMGLYSDSLKVSYGSMGGWNPFGPERKITRSQGNVLYELDGRSALELYKSYLGKHAEKLPASALLFPLSLRLKGKMEAGLVRTVLAVDEEQQSMTFAGDIPQDAFARFMKTNIDHLVDGSQGAAELCRTASCSQPPELALLISCVGRRLVMRQRVEEEIEVVSEIFGPDTALSGFYSYGEISPFTGDGKCELHNQTMTVTTLTEE